MTSDFETPDPPHDTGSPDPVETDPAALSSAEDLDEDRLKLDPLEAGMDPPERWTAADKYGMTAYEQAHPRPLDDRLAEEQPDVRPVAAGEPGAGDLSRDDVVSLDAPDAYDEEVHREAAERGQLADEPGGSVAEAMRTPDAVDEN
ncbi:hypothetical protein [Actinosynnema sp. NPDC023587]|uniref:hypothetical protein n=1 Tax=Actinosynnema sp. NPDC023587 TaxID=3154695 RepID=UPI0033C891A3